MIPETDILESNLSRLFARAYAPVQVSPAFRARLLEDLGRRIVPAAPPRNLFGWRTAAAILLAIGSAFALWRVLGSGEEAPSVEQLLASGSPALRVGHASAWRPLSAKEIRSGIPFAASPLEVATPAGIAVQVHLAPAGDLEARGESLVSVEGAPESALSVLLEHGEIEVARNDVGAPWRIASSEGSILFDHGAIEVACLADRSVREMRVLLRSGAAAVEADPQVELVPGREIVLRGGALLAAEILDAPPPAGTTPRTGVSAEEPAASASAEPPADVVETAPPPTTSLRGKLSVPDGATPPDSFTVALLRRERLPQVGEPTMHPFTDTGGEFEIEELRPGTWSVFVRADGFAVWQSRGIEIQAGQPAELSVHLATGIAVRGRVLDPEGKPVEGALVLSEDDAPQQILPLSEHGGADAFLAQAESGPDGRFEIPRLSARGHILRATRAGFGAGWSDRVDLSADAPSDEVLIRLSPSGAIEGEVRHDDGTPWPGAILVASFIDLKAEHACMSFGMSFADATGAYAIEDLPPGLYAVLNVADRTGSKGAAGTRVVQLQVAAGQRVRFDLPEGRSGTRVEGRLVDSDGSPVTGVHVTLQLASARHEQDWKSMMVDEDGRFTFPSLAPGEYAAVVGQSMDGDFVLQGLIEVPAAPRFDYELRLPAGTLRGRVVDRETGRGLPGCALILESDDGRGWSFAGKQLPTELDGRFEFRFLRPGSYRVTAFALRGRYAPESAMVTCSDPTAPPTPFDLALSPGAALLVQVVDEKGIPVEAVALEFSDASGGQMVFSGNDRTDARGRFQIPGIAAGRWTIAAERTGRQPERVTVDLIVGEEREVRIVMPSTK